MTGCQGGPTVFETRTCQPPTGFSVAPEEVRRWEGRLCTVWCMSDIQAYMQAASKTVLFLCALLLLGAASCAAGSLCVPSGLHVVAVSSAHSLLVVLDGSR
jgi:hypothetical protein